MKIFVMVDMEGISGIFCKSQVLPGSDLYQEGRRFLTMDTNACVAGCFDGGASEVVVRDAHGGGYHFVWEDLDSRAMYVRGSSPDKRMPAIESFDGLILLGYHAMAGTPRAILEHTMSSVNWQNFWINGKLSGEVAIDAAIAGDSGVPTIMVSGDDKVCHEARSLIPGIVTAEVKQGLDLEGGIMLSAESAHTLVRTMSAEAVGRISEIKPYKVSSPVELKLELVSRGKIPFNRPGVTVMDGRTYSVTADTVDDAIKLL